MARFRDTYTLTGGSHPLVHHTLYFILLLWTIPSYYTMVVICAMPNLDPYLKPLPEFCSARESSFVYSATEVSFNVPMSHSDVG